MLSASLNKTFPSFLPSILTSNWQMFKGYRYHKHLPYFKYSPKKVLLHMTIFLLNVTYFTMKWHCMVTVLSNCRRPQSGLGEIPLDRHVLWIDHRLSKRSVSVCPPRAAITAARWCLGQQHFEWCVGEICFAIYSVKPRTVPVVFVAEGSFDGCPRDVLLGITLPI